MLLQSQSFSLGLLLFYSRKKIAFLFPFISFGYELYLCGILLLLNIDLVVIFDPLFAMLSFMSSEFLSLGPNMYLS